MDIELFNMFTVIIPTLWKVDFKFELLKLEQSSFVEEIILIDNNKRQTPDWIYELNLKKLTIVQPNKNLYVNPSWNLGVKIAKCKYIILLNDDVVIDDYNFLNIVLEELEKEKSIIGIDRSCYSNSSTTGIPIFNDITHTDRTIGFGCVMFFEKQLYKDIPSEYLIWRGDDFLIDLFKHRNNKVKTISNLNMSESQMCVSSNLPEFSWKEEKEHPKEKYEHYLKEYLNEDSNSISF